MPMMMPEQYAGRGWCWRTAPEMGFRQGEAVRKPLAISTGTPSRRSDPPERLAVGLGGVAVLHPTRSGDPHCPWRAHTDDGSRWPSRSAHSRPPVSRSGRSCADNRHGVPWGCSDAATPSSPSSTTHSHLVPPRSMPQSHALPAHPASCHVAATLPLSSTACAPAHPVRDPAQWWCSVTSGGQDAAPTGRQQRGLQALLSICFAALSGRGSGPTTHCTGRSRRPLACSGSSPDECRDPGWKTWPLPLPKAGQDGGDLRECDPAWRKT